MSHFYMFAPTKENVKLANRNTGRAQGIGIISCFVLIVPLYIHMYKFIIVLVNLLTTSHWLTSNVMLVKELHHNLFNIVILLTLNIILGYHSTILEFFRLSSNQNCNSQPSIKQEYFGPNCLWPIKT